MTLPPAARSSGEPEFDRVEPECDDRHVRVAPPAAAIAAVPMAMTASGRVASSSRIKPG